MAPTCPLYAEFAPLLDRLKQTGLNENQIPLALELIGRGRVLICWRLPGFTRFAGVTVNPIAPPSVPTNPA